MQWNRVRAVFRSMLALALASSVLSAVAGAAEENAAAKLEQLRSQRRELAHRQRGILFDNDGNEPVKHCTEVTREALLAPETTPLAGTQVDSIFYCTWSSGFGLFTHATKIGQVFTSKAMRWRPFHGQSEC
ncbi:MAG: hypothetical protein GXY83_08710 [Rhodopirellula sp.]|nr:hypothetical protein [Rhodopirellula sp.]